MACSLALIPLGLWLWVSGGTRDVSSLNPYITESLLEGQPDFAITLGKSHVRWERLYEAARIEVADVTLTYRGQPFFVVPRLELTMDVFSAIGGKVQARDVVARQPSLSVLRNKNDEWFWVGQSGEGLPLAALAGLSGKQEGDTHKAPFRSLAIEDANVEVYDEASDSSYSAKGADIRLLPNTAEEKIYTEFNLPITLDGEETRISGKSWVDVASRDSLWQLNVRGLSLMRLCGFGDWCNEDMPSLDMVLSGKTAFKLKGGATLEQIALDVHGKDGTFTFKPHFPEVIKLDEFTLKANVKGDATKGTVEQIALRMGDTKVQASGALAKHERGYKIALDGDATHMPVNDLYKYWPATLAPASREWATTSIRGGLATTASASIRLEPEDFETRFFPDDFLHAEVNVQNTTVNYIKDYPKAKNVSGKVTFTGTTLTATANDAAAMTGTKLKRAKIFFPDLNEDGTPVEIDLSLTSPTGDVLEFIKPPRFDFLKRAPIAPSGPKGTAEGTIRLAFDAFTGKKSDVVDWDAVEYDIKADLNDVGGVTYDSAYRIEKASGRFEASNERLHTQLSAAVNGSPMTLGYDEGKGILPRYRIKGTLSENMLRQAGMEAEDVLKGPVMVDATVEKRASGDAIVGTVDLTKASLNVDAIGYKKAAGVPARLAIKPTQSKDNLMIDYSSDALKLNGSVWLDLSTQEVKALALPTVRYGKQDFALRYSTSAQGKSIEMKGRYADLSEWLGEDSSEGQSISSVPAFKLALDMETLVLGPQRELRSARGHILCTPQRCESADITARFPDQGGMELSIRREGGQRRFSLTSDNAGNMLRAFDAVDKMYGGEFSLTGAYDDARPGNPLSGRLIITKFNLKDAPILGRILNLSSLSGLMESLSGTGISFDKLAADIVFANDLATIKNGKASGASLGIMMDGAVNLASSDIQVEGSFAPAHMLNSIISKIPIIGVALAGGEGQSIFAFNYSVDGKYTNPQVSVNPLSVLTPGFTRRFFDVFDKPLPKELQQPGETQAAPPAVQ